MIEVEEFDWGLRVVDGAKNQVDIEIDDWEVGGEAMNIDRHVEERIAGYGSEIRIPGQTVVIESSSREELIHLSPNSIEQFPPGYHIIQTDDGIATYVATKNEFEICVVLTKGVVKLSFIHLADFTLGVRSHIRQPPKTLQLKRELSDISRAVSRFGDSHLTDSPDRSYPSMRGHPPLLEFSKADSCDSVNTTSTKEINIQISESLKDLFAVTPLAYYLGASIETADSITPLITTSGVEYQFREDTPLWVEASKLLKRVFYLDCLVRTAGPHGVDTKEVNILRQINVDSSKIFDLSMGDRFEEYCDIGLEDYLDKFPEWQFSASISPSYENVPSLSALANNLAILNMPKSKELTAGYTILKSLTQYGKSRGGHNNRLNIIEPVNSEGAIHGWYGQNVAIGAFNGLPGSEYNRYRKRGEDKLPIHVILNDESMGDESSEVLAEYGSRFKKAGSRVQFHQEVSINELSNLLEEESAFLHYVGHCEDSGLLCHDGFLSPNSLKKSGAQSFFINACNSYHIGEELVLNGSIAGGVTVGNVLDKQAELIGTTFARLVCHGLTISQSLELARSKSLMNHQYTIIGDGTFCISQGGNNTPEIRYVEKDNGDDFLIDQRSVSPAFHGSIFQSELASEPVLQGNSNQHRITYNQLEWLLQFSDAPCVMEDELYWPEDLYQLLCLDNEDTASINIA